MSINQIPNELEHSIVIWPNSNTFGESSVSVDLAFDSCRLIFIESGNFKLVEVALYFMQID